MIVTKVRGNILACTVIWERMRVMRRILASIGMVALTGCSVTGQVNTNVVDFDSCTAAGFPVMESFPRQCRGPDGTLFVEAGGSASPEPSDIRIIEPAANASVPGTFDVTGEARGTWFFEASFPWFVEDAEGDVLVRGTVQTKENWMTEEMIPFRFTITVPAGTAGRGLLVLQKDNPSGLPENEDSLRIPLRF